MERFIHRINDHAAGTRCQPPGAVEAVHFANAATLVGNDTLFLVVRDSALNGNTFISYAPGFRFRYKQFLQLSMC